jgi:hypothetical protein
VIGPLYGSLGPLTIPRKRQAYIDYLLGLPGLVALWPLNDAVGSTTAVDLKGSYNGTASGGVTFGVAGTAGMTAAGFDGVNDLVSIPYLATIVTTGTYTMSAWFRQSEAANGSVFEVSNGGANRNGIVIMAGQLGCGFYNGSAYTRKSVAAPSLNAWHHVGYTNASGTITGYLDGVSFSGVGAGNLSLGPSAIGYGTNAGYFKASVAFPFICSQALDAATIAEIYARGIA